MNFVLTAGRVQNPKNLVDVICEHVLGKLIWMAFDILPSQSAYSIVLFSSKNLVDVIGEQPLVR